MGNLRILSAAEQVAEHLRTELLSERWTETMPGEDKLIAQLGVGRATVQAAVRQLEEEGWLVSQGPGKRRLIALQENQVHPAMRIAILLYEPDDALNRYIFELRHALLAAGHELHFAPMSLVELKHDPKRVARMVKEHPSEAWIIQAGSRPVLEWFAKSSVPCFALFGRMQGLPIAGTGPDMLPALRQAIQSLTNKGHRRIVHLTREERRKPSPGLIEQVFLDELEKADIAAGPYNLPDWVETDQGLRDCLEALFRVTPPNALLIGDWILFLAVQNFIAMRKNQGMKPVALICTDSHPSFKWCAPSIPHIHWDHKPMVRRIVRWAGNITRGKDDRRQGLTLAKFIAG